MFLVAIPACGNAIVYRRRRDALKKIIFSTISSTVIIAILNVFIKETYFIDTSIVIGTATLFFFIISLSLCHMASKSLPHGSRSVKVGAVIKREGVKRYIKRYKGAFYFCSFGWSASWFQGR